MSKWASANGPTRASSASPRWRWPAVLLAVLVVWATPWPAPTLLFSAALPSSFHRAPPSASDTAAIAHGLQLFQANCASCHGADGRGDTPLAASLAVWPPRLSGGLLWKRPEGEIYWRLLHGLRDRRGRPTMPGFADRMALAEAWALIAGMKALASGQSLRSEGCWTWPLAAPELRILCDGRPQTLARWQGQRVRIVLAGGQTGRPGPAWPREHARFQTVVLATQGPGCIAPDPAARQVFSALSGVEALAAGTQFLVDRQGWLRAMNRPGEGDWAADDLLCRSGAGTASGTTANGAGLDALIRRMDADPVRVLAVMGRRQGWH